MPKQAELAFLMHCYASYMHESKAAAGKQAKLAFLGQSKAKGFAYGLRLTLKGLGQSLKAYAQAIG